MLSGPQRKFCEGIVKGHSATEAYAKAYPKSSKEAARRSASDLLSNPDIKAEIEKLRAKADEKAGSAVLTLAEKRAFLARVVRMNGATVERDSDLVNGIRLKQAGESFGEELLLPDKLKALELDAKLAGEFAGDKAADKQADATNALAQALARIQSVTHG